MQAFLIERLTGREWRRGGRVYWTVESARREAQRQISTGRAVAVRILAADVELQPVDNIAVSAQGAAR